MSLSTTIVLTNAAKKLFRTNKRLRVAIFDRWEVYNLVTLQRWLRTDDPRLVHPDTIQLIHHYTELPIDQITEQVEITEKQPVA